LQAHEAGLAHLLRRNDAAALTFLREAASGSHDPVRWNDLAAALLVQSETSDDVSLAVDALAAANRALALDSHHAAASFNRALALRRLGLLREARREWQRFLDLDVGSAWTDEALRHLHDLGCRNDNEEWRRVFGVLRRDAGSVGDEALRSIVERFPQYARRSGENVLLVEWADAALRGDYAAAIATLGLARRLGDQLLRRSGEALLADAVARIDAAIRKGTAKSMAVAIAAYRDGRVAHHAHRPGEAEKKLREAEWRLRSCGSPIANAATYYLGSALHAQLRVDEASTLLEALASKHLQQRGYRTLAAEIGWERGACLLDHSAISDAMEVFDTSRKEAEVLGEGDLAASMNAFLAVTFDVIGDERAAWHARSRALEQTSRSGGESSLVILDSAAVAASGAGEWDRAAALLGLTIDAAERQQNVPVAAHAYAERAVLHADLGDAFAAAADVGRSRRWSARLDDRQTQARADADVAFAEAMTVRERHPSAALRLFSASIKFYREGEDNIELPRIFLEQARVKQRLGRTVDARRDLDSGLGIVALERSQLRDFNQRAALTATSADLFEEALRLAVDTGDASGAFRLAEENRGRALTEMNLLTDDRKAGEIAPMPLDVVRESLASDAAIVVYAALPERLVAFVVRREGVKITSANVARVRLAATIEKLRRACRSTADLRSVLAAAGAADELLLAPVRRELKGIRQIAFIGDAYVSNVPFTALYDAASRCFLIERAAIVIAPSATLAVRTSSRLEARPPRSVLTVAGSVFDAAQFPAADPLPAARREATAIAALYPEARLLEGEGATRKAILAAAGGYDVVHIASHAIGRRDGVLEPMLLLAPSSGNHGELRASDIVCRRMPHVRTVVLAACGSASTRASSDGAASLALAFIAAGVPTVVASLWDMDDEVAMRTMTMLHREMAHGTDPAAALRATVTDGLRDRTGRIVLPLRWSNMILVGGSAGLTKKEKRDETSNRPHIAASGGFDVGGRVWLDRPYGKHRRSTSGQLQ